MKKFSDYLEESVTGKPKLVGYQWIYKWDEVYSVREDGLVIAKVSDWDRAVKSEISGRNITHVYLIDDGRGNVKGYGKISALKALGIYDDTPTENYSHQRWLFDKKAKQLRDELEYKMRLLNNASRELKMRLSDDILSMVKNAKESVFKSHSTMSTGVLFVKKDNKYAYLLTAGEDVYTRDELASKAEHDGFKVIPWKEINAIYKSKGGH